MKQILSAAVLGLVAAEATKQVHIPLDCYSETFVFGKNSGVRKSDFDILTGHNPLQYKPSAITACVDTDTTLISGVAMSFS